MTSTHAAAHVCRFVGISSPVEGIGVVGPIRSESRRSALRFVQPMHLNNPPAVGFTGEIRYRAQVAFAVCHIDVLVRRLHTSFAVPTFPSGFSGPERHAFCFAHRLHRSTFPPASGGANWGSRRQASRLLPNVGADGYWMVSIHSAWRTRGWFLPRFASPSPGG